MACAEGEPQAVGGSVRACFAVWSAPLQSCCIEHVRVGALSVCVQSANVVGSFFRVPAASHVVSVRSKHFPDGIYNSHTNGAVGGALFQILVRSPNPSQPSGAEFKSRNFSKFLRTPFSLPPPPNLVKISSKVNPTQILKQILRKLDITGVSERRSFSRVQHTHQTTYAVTWGRECRYQKHPGAWSGSEIKAYNATVPCGNVAC